MNEKITDHPQKEEREEVLKEIRQLENRSAAWMDFPACAGVIPSIAAISFSFIPSI